MNSLSSLNSPDPLIDANLAIALDALLAEQSVTRAAARLHTSPAAMSRTLARLRRILQDPLLVRAGQTMVPTPRAQALREEAAAVVRSLGVLLESRRRRRSRRACAAPSRSRPPTWSARRWLPDCCNWPGRRRRGSRSGSGPRSWRPARPCATAGSTWRSAPSTTSTPRPRSRNWSPCAWWRPSGPGIRSTEGRLTPARLAAAEHVVVSRRGRFTGPLDTALAERGLQRRVERRAAQPPGRDGAGRPQRRRVPGPRGAAGRRGLAAHRQAVALGLRLLDIPLELPPLAIGMAWHPRHAADGAHRWLRGAVRRTLGATAT